MALSLVDQAYTTEIANANQTYANAKSTADRDLTVALAIAESNLSVSGDQSAYGTAVNAANAAYATAIDSATTIRDTAKQAAKDKRADDSSLVNKTLADDETLAEKTYDLAESAARSAETHTQALARKTRQTNIAALDSAYATLRDQSWSTSLATATSPRTDPWTVQARQQAAAKATRMASVSTATSTHDAALASYLADWTNSNIDAKTLAINARATAIATSSGAKNLANYNFGTNAPVSIGGITGSGTVTGGGDSPFAFVGYGGGGTDPKTIGVVKDELPGKPSSDASDGVLQLPKYPAGYWNGSNWNAQRVLIAMRSIEDGEQLVSEFQKRVVLAPTDGEFKIDTTQAGGSTILLSIPRSWTDEQVLQYLSTDGTDGTDDFLGKLQAALTVHANANDGVANDPIADFLKDRHARFQEAAAQIEELGQAFRSIGIGEGAVLFVRATNGDLYLYIAESEEKLQSLRALPEAVRKNPETSLGIGVVAVVVSKKALRYLDDATRTIPIPGSGWTAKRVDELRAMIPSAQQGYITMSVGLARDPKTGKMVRLISTSEPAGYLRPGVTLNRGERLIPGTGHAEVDIVNYARSQGLELWEIGATRPICDECAKILGEALPVTPLKNP